MTSVKNSSYLLISVHSCEEKAPKVLQRGKDKNALPFRHKYFEYFFKIPYDSGLADLDKSPEQLWYKNETTVGKNDFLLFYSPV